MRVNVSEELKEYCPLTIWQIILMILRQIMPVICVVAAVVLTRQMFAAIHSFGMAPGDFASVLIWNVIAITLGITLIVTHPSLRKELNRYHNRNRIGYGVVFFDTGTGFDVSKPFLLSDISKTLLGQPPYDCSLCIIASLSSKRKGEVVWGTVGVGQDEFTKRDNANYAFRHWLLEPRFVTTEEGKVGNTTFWIGRHSGYGSTVVGVEGAFRFFRKGAAITPYFHRSFEFLLRALDAAETAAQEANQKARQVIRNLAAAHLVITSSKRYQHVRSDDAMLARVIIEQAMEILAGGIRAELLLAELHDEAAEIVAATRQKIRTSKKGKPVRELATT